MIQIGEMLDFDRRFCAATIDELLSNVHITRAPVIFDDENIKECFFRDALRVALVDGEFHPKELSWLRKMARANDKTDEWLDSIIEEVRREQRAAHHSAPLEIQQYV